MPDAQIQRDKPLVGATALFVVAGLAFLGIEVLEGEQERFEQALAALVAGASGLFVVVRGWYLRHAGVTPESLQRTSEGR